MEMVEITYPVELIEMLQPGNVVRIHYGKDNINNELRHIRAVVDGDQIVYRVWKQQSWHYRMRDAYSFLLAYEKGYLTRAA